MTKKSFRNWVEERTVKKKIKKKLLIEMGFNFINGVGVKYLKHGDVLCALRAPDKTYAVRSVLGTHERPFLTEVELIRHLTEVGED